MIGPLNVDSDYDFSERNQNHTNNFDDKMCSFCEFKPPEIFKNKQDYNYSLQNHLLKKHLKDHVEDELPKRTPFICPVSGCFYSQITNKFNDYDFLFNHYTGKHINFELFIKQNDEDNSITNR